MKLDSVVGLITNSSSVIFAKLDMNRVARILELLIECGNSNIADVYFYYNNTTYESYELERENVGAFQQELFKKLAAYQDKHGYEKAASDFGLLSVTTAEAHIVEEYNDIWAYDEGCPIAKTIEDIPTDCLAAASRRTYPYFALAVDNQNKTVIEESKLLSQQLEMDYEYG